MNLNEKPRPSFGDTLRAALPMKWLVALQNVVFFIMFSAGVWPAKITFLLHDKFGFSHDFAETAPLFVMVSAFAAYLFLSWLKAPYDIKAGIQKRREREYSRQQKVMVEHEKILERWQREVKPEGDSTSD